MPKFREKYQYLTALDINIFLWILAHIKIIALSTKVCPRFSKKKKKRFNFFCVLVFKNTIWLAFIKILKSSLIFIILQIAETLFFLNKLICLAENFKAKAQGPFELELVKVKLRGHEQHFSSRRSRKVLHCAWI